MSNWKTYKYSPKKSGNSFKNATTPIVLLIVFIGFIFLAYVGITAFIKNLDEIGITQQKPSIKPRIENIQPPLLSNIPKYTKEKSITIEGYSVEKATITLYKNGKEVEKMETNDDGEFKFENINLDSGDNEFYATSSANDRTSIPSSKLLITVDTEKPELSVNSPEPGAEVTANSEDELVTVSGTTEPDVELTVNGRIASINESGDFSVSINVKEGTNKVTAEATDPAGNKTKEEFEFIVKFNNN